MDSKRAKNLGQRDGSADERRRLWAAAALLGVVLGSLLLAAVLEADPRDGLAATPQPAEAAAAVHDPTAVAEPARPADAESDVAARARRDGARLATLAGRWTLQLMVTCDERALREALERAGQHDEMALIEAVDQGPGCYRVVWGAYAGRDAAGAATGIPTALLPPGQRPWPRPVEQVLAP